MQATKLPHAFLLTIIGIFAAAPALADHPDPHLIYVNSITNQGSGCTPGSVSYNISPDRQALTLLFDDFVAESNGADNIPLVKRTCNVDIGLHIPSGWSYGIFKVDFRGYASLDQNVTGVLASRYRVDGSQVKDLGEMRLQGPVDKDYMESNEIPVLSVSWSKCSIGEVNPLTIEADISVINPPPAAFDARAALDESRKLEKEMRELKTFLRIALDKRHELVQLSDVVFDAADKLEDEVRRKRPLPQLQQMFQGIQDLAATLLTKVGEAGNLRHGDRINKAAAATSRHLSKLQILLFPVSDMGNGLLTVDSLDGSMKHQYGIVWRQCRHDDHDDHDHDSGVWIQGDGKDACPAVCAKKGLSLGTSPEGAQCVSGEARPESAQGIIDFVKGCWGGCGSQGPVATQAAGRFCYKSGQKRDNDRTDLAVGCFCQ